MNAHDVLFYGHLWVHKHLDGLADDQWLSPGVCGYWSVKDIIAHLASFEYVLVDVFNGVVNPGPTLALDQFKSMDGDTFNGVQVALRQVKAVGEVLADYDNGYNQAIHLLPRLDADFLRQPGTIPWYGNEYSLEDYIVYQFYGHKREHMAQVAVYRDSLKPV